MKSTTLALAALAATLAVAHPFRKFTPPNYAQLSRQLTIDADARRAFEKRSGGYIGKDDGGDPLVTTTTTIVYETVWITPPADGFIGASTDVNVVALNTVPAPFETTTAETTPSTTPTTVKSSTSTKTSTSTTSSASSMSIAAPTSYAAPPPTTSSSAPSTTAPASSAAPPTSSAAAAQPSSNPATGFGLAWSPYLTDGCKSSSQAQSEFAQMQGYGIVRIYGTDCDQVSLAVQYAQQYGMKIFAEIYDLDNVTAEAGTIVSAVNGNWDIIDTISVGNEDVNNGVAVSTVASAMAQAQSVLSAAGFNGNLVHVDTQNAFESNPDMCTPSVAGSYVAANIHPFFNAQTAADQAAQFVETQIGLLQSCAASVGSNRVRVTETGWPKEGEDDGAAVPSKANQDIVVAGIKGLSNAQDAIFLSSFDDTWKAPGPFNCEQFWGILDD